MAEYIPNTGRYDTMRYRKCGNSGIMLPEISLGFWHNFGGNTPSSEMKQIVECAFDNGITHFDLANNYGPPPGSAEENFGKIVRQSLANHRDELIITSKAGHAMWNGPYGDGGSRKSLMASIDQSLKRLQTDYVDVFYSHRYDSATPIEETLQALVDIVKSGKALYVGLSKYPADQALYAFDYLKAAHTPCLMYQDRYNMLTREVEDKLLPLAKSRQVGFIAFSPLAQGLLTDKYMSGIPENSRAARPDGYLKIEEVTDKIIYKVRNLQNIASERGQTIAQMAISWLLKDRGVSSVIVGASSKAQLQSNLAALGKDTFTETELTAIRNILAQE